MHRRDGRGDAGQEDRQGPRRGVSEVEVLQGEEHRSPLAGPLQQAQDRFGEPGRAAIGPHVQVARSLDDGQRAELRQEAGQGFGAGAHDPDTLRLVEPGEVGPEALDGRRIGLARAAGHGPPAEDREGLRQAAHPARRSRRRGG